MKEDLKTFAAVCESIARSSGAILMDYQGQFHIREKGPADLVTEADYASQKNVQTRLAEAFPTHILLGEEATPNSDAQGGTGICRWIVDPLDGTTNYTHGVPQFCVSLAMEQNGILQVATIYAPQMDECYTAVRGQGAFLNGKPIHVSTVTDPMGSLVATGFPPATKIDCPDVQAFLHVLNFCQAIRRTGSTALNLAYVAAGRYDAAWNFRTNLWDIAAGMLLVQEAGGVLCTTDGTPFDINGTSYLVASTTALSTFFLGKFSEE